MQNVFFGISSRGTKGLRYNTVLRNGVLVQISQIKILSKSLFFYCETEAGDFQNKMFITNPLTFLLKSENIPDSILRQHYYLPFQENQDRLQT